MGTKFPNEYFHGSIVNFNDYFLTRKAHAFSLECDNLRLAERLEFSKPFLSLK